MVRVFIKGGVWKNSEDEILKAAIMKYGKQQWARVASLLNRKSAKQCKARWNEWLDPSVKKVEWSREEEEKLLHLAKLLPSQWRTIGGLLNGRSATQCQEHYERLLDEAVMNQTGQSENGDSTNVAEGLRRHTLRPGDIDSHPETKPARPDPIDMDEDEIEMLQEARARLANTQGKKAKRKQREKILNEAKRLADLQKRRELKQAGLMSSKMKRKSRGSKREIDLGVEIPFHKPAPAGFHNVSVEDEKAERIRQNRLKKVNFQKVNEANYRSRDREAAMAQKREENRLRSLERANAALAVHEVSKRNDPIAERKRGILKMPSPTVDDDELREVAKLAKQHDSSKMLPPPNRAPSSISGVTDALLGDYSDRPLPTPMRTPLNRDVNDTPANRVKSVLREASQLRMIERQQTPLLATTLEDDNDEDDQNQNQNQQSFVGGATPRIDKKPQPFSTPLDRSVNQTPSNSSIMAPRDQLGLNRPSTNYDDNASVTSSAFFSTAGGGASTIASFSGSKRSIRDIAREERRAAKRARAELEAALKALPSPQFEYELAVPEVSNDEDNNDDIEDPQKKKMRMVKDAADVEKEELQKLRIQAEKAYEAQSTVLKRADLPRPLATSISSDILETYMGTYSASASDDQHLVDAAQLISEEMMTLVQHDAFSNPPEISFENLVDTGSKHKKKHKEKKKSKKKSKSPSSNNVIEFISEDSLQSARDLLEKETQVLMDEQKDRHRLQIAQSTTEHPNDEAVMRGITSHNIQSSLANANPSTMLFTEDSPEKPPKWLLQSKKQENFTKSQRVNALKLQFYTIKNSSTTLKKRSEKIRAKLNIKHGGYAKRVSDFSQNILQSFAEMQHSKIEEQVYSNLMENEEQEIWDRRMKLQKDIDALTEIEEKMKLEYEEALAKRDQLYLLQHKH